MAAPMRWSIFRAFQKTLKDFSVKGGYGTLQRRLICASDSQKAAERGSDETTQGGTTERDPGAAFILPEVQKILAKITGLDIAKVFELRFAEVAPPTYKLMTDKQLEEAQEEAIVRAQERLQMPPVLKAWDDSFEVISEDTLIENHDTHRYVFTDISFNKPERSRTVVVREVDGTLRTSTATEHDRMMHIYFPKPGRMYRVPDMFTQEDKLEAILNAENYDYILDRACVQFEPDDPMYIQVVQRTYEHIANQGSYDTLRSTRHFGGMVFYFALHKHIEGLLVDMIQRDLLTDAADTIRLFHILHPESQSATKAANVSDPMEIIKIFIETDAREGGKVELALQAHLDSRRKKQVPSS